MKKIIFISVGLMFSMLGFSQDGSLDPSFNPGTATNGIVVDALVQPDGKILISGFFSSYNNNPCDELIRLNPDGTQDLSFTNVLNTFDRFCSFALQNDGKIIVMTNEIVSNQYFEYVYRLNSDGSLDASFVPFVLKGFAGNKSSIDILNDGKFLISGYFFYYNNLSRKGLIRLNSDGTLDQTFNFNDQFLTYIDSLLLLPDGKIVLTYGTTEDSTVPFMKKIKRILHDGTIDNSFTSYEFYGNLSSLQPDGKIVVLIKYDWGFMGPPAVTVTRLNSDGTTDNNFIPVDWVVENPISTFVQPNGKILVTGGFFSYDIPNQVKCIMRLNSDGTLDTSFTSGFNNSTSYNDSVLDMQVQTDGKIIIVGSFSFYDGISRKNIARINNTTLGINDFESKTITTFPNPVKDVLYLNLPDGLVTKDFEIYNSLGRIVSNASLNNNQINISDLSSGFYLLKVKTDNGNYSSKFLKN